MIETKQYSVFNYIGINVDETSSLYKKIGQNTTIVMMKKNQVGDDNMFTSAMKTTLFTEATRMSQP